MIIPSPKPKDDESIDKALEGVVEIVEEMRKTSAWNTGFIEGLKKGK